MFLKSIHLLNVKCFEEIFLSFEDEKAGIRKWTLLLGENGTGKSTLLKAIPLVTSGSDALLDLLDEPGDWIRYEKPSCEIAAVLVTKAQKERKIALHIERSDSRADVIVRNRENLAPLDDARDDFVLGFGTSRRLHSMASRRAKTSGFTSKRAQRVATLFDPDATLSPLESWVMDLDDMEERTGLKTVQNVLDDFLPGIKFHHIDKKSGCLLFSTPDGIVPLGSLSDGYQAMSAWIGDLLYRVWEVSGDKREPLKTRGLLLIDQVDLHLHPKWQRELLSFLDKRLKNFQLIVTTQSPITAQQAGVGQLHCLRREAGKIQISPFTGNPKTLLLNQLLMTDAFGLDTDESFEIEEKKHRYRQLRDKAHLSPKEKAELDQLTAYLTDLPVGGRSNLQLSEEHARLLQKIEKELREGRS